MPITQELLEKRINAIENSWVGVEGGLTDESIASGDHVNIIPFWQFRIAIKPERNNAIKALNALKELQQFKRSRHPEFKVFLPSESSDLSTWDSSLKGGDRDQRGKEICVYMEHLASGYNPGYYKGNYPDPEYLKALILDMWKALQDAGVEMAYISPGVGEKELGCESGMITPFFYSAFKPYKGRHGILNQTQYNPLNLTDPLSDVSISGEDLKAHGIHPLGALKSAQRLVYQIDHYNRQLKAAQIQLSDLVNSNNTADSAEYTLNALANYNQYTSQQDELDKLISQETTTPAILASRLEAYCAFVGKNAMQLTLPAESSLNEPSLLRHINILNSLARETDPDKDTIRTRYFNSLPETVTAAIEKQEPIKDEQFFQVVVQEILKDVRRGFEQEMKSSVDEMMGVCQPVIKREQLEAAFKRDPYQFQKLYQRLQVLDFEKQTILGESQRFDSLPKPTEHPSSYDRMSDQTNSLANARNILNDYTKNNSLFSRLIHGHWNRHHVKEVHEIVKDIDAKNIKNMDELVMRLSAIHLENPKGSLARRMEFIVLPYTEKLTHAFRAVHEPEESLTVQAG
ncbi:DUF5617 domain-containing protein [Legionella shakespearei]|uniref:RavJ-like C-terminal domain-containing protein n=1 Tax=Legionella shakespearei DSM 23087 TaxID=1122169 RepID=A0A0W0YVI3_9GAMM|nr:DUF5617 domain-containing protein [Legionella shakespearei]KTD60836.1 hypothetical protein Lsha_1553 [Legionella shakespearei DSM 23087]